MKASMRKRGMALLMLLVLALGLAADAAADGLGRIPGSPIGLALPGGTAEDETWLQVSVGYGGGQITLAQDAFWPLEMTNRLGVRRRSMHLAAYAVFCYPVYNGLCQTEGAVPTAFDALTCELSLGQGEYLLQIVPGQPEEIVDKTQYSEWVGQRWLEDTPSWRVTGYSGCTVSLYGGNTLPAGVTVTVEHRAVDGQTLLSEQVTLPDGTHQLTARYDLPGFTPTGRTVYPVAVSGGMASAYAVTFYYLPSAAQVTVNYKTMNGQLLYSETQTLEDGTHQILCSRTFAGYTLADLPIKLVSVTNGVPSTDEITFVFLASGGVATAQITVVYQAEDGAWTLTGDRKSYSPGVYTVQPDFLTREVEGSTYVITGPQSFDISVSADGTASANVLTFRYKRQSTPLSGRQVTATAKVFVRSGPGIDYGDVTDMKKGDTAVYLDESARANGVTWYKIRFYKNKKEYTGWVSSKYAELE